MDTVHSSASTVAASNPLAAIALAVGTVGNGTGERTHGTPNSIVEGTAPVLQSGDGYHVAAVFGILILAIIGGLLIVRNRLDARADVGPTNQESNTDEVVTDREKVRRLIRNNGGRMKQAEIVDSVEWSKAKVSRLLADLEADGEITKLRIGRENLICLPGHEPTASQSSDRRGSE